MNPEIDYGRIDALFLDVDGVLTDGSIVLTPGGEEIKRFNVRDGAGMKYWKRVGKKIAVVSGRGSEAVSRRCKELDVDFVRLNAKDKLPAYEEALAAMGVSGDRVAAVGDDLPDLPPMRRCGLAIAVADAVVEVKAAAAYVTAASGGHGAVREVIEMILKKAGLWEQVLQRYLAENK